MSGCHLIQFLDLAEDVLLHVLSHCAVRDLLSLERASKYLALLVSTREVWMAAVHQLPADQPPDIAPHQSPSALSASDLRDLAVRAVRGHKNWHTDICPRVTREMLLTPLIRTGDGFMPWMNEARLLSGGQHVFFQMSGGFQCWHVERNVCVWEYEIQGFVQAFDLEAMDNGNVAMMAVCIRVYQDPRQNFVHILRLDLCRYKHTVALELTLPATEYDNPLQNPKIHGAIVAVWFDHRVLLANWATGSRVFLEEMCPSRHYNYALLNSHLLCFIPEEMAVDGLGDRLVVIPYTKLFPATDQRGEWLSLPKSTWLCEALLPPTRLHHRPRQVMKDIFVSVCHPTWQTASTTVSVMIESIEDRPSDPPSESYFFTPDFCSYFYFRLSLQDAITETDSSPDFSLEGHHEFGPCDMLYLRGSIPRSGHTIVFGPNKRSLNAFCISRKDAPFLVLDDIEHACDNLHVEEYSGAITYSTNKEIVVRYYD